jgi:hypothetical protein
MLIQDIVHIDKSADFRSDVRLTSFYEPETNLALLRSYLFSSQAPEGQVASLEMLNIALERFLNPNLENRLLLIANYGHGKSHLALMMANYFAQTPESEAFRIIGEKIRNAARDSAAAQRFIEFKKTRPRHLVLILSGDRPVPLRQAFLQAVDKALQQYPETQSAQPPLWFEKAQQWLSEKVAANLDWRERAESFLESQHQVDLALLQQRLKERDSDMFEVCRSLFRHLTGAAPDFGAEVALADILDWLVDEFCTEGKPFDGLLVLFDEFSLFLDRYYQSSAGDLQDLLNGVDKHRGRAVFLALAQHDPDSLLNFRARSRPNDPKIEEVRKELTRIPSASRKVLHTLMESVLDSYLDQDEQNWATIHRQCTRFFSEASETTYKIFRNRYQDALRWGEGKTDEVLTKGCFPLHPLTAALLCNLPLHTKSGSNPRTVLGFVLERVRALAAQLAISSDGRPNWILPIELVDEFGEMLDEDLYRAYQNTLRHIGTDAPEVWKQVIKAMLLYDAQQFNPSEVPYERALAHMTGLDEVQVQDALHDLRNKNYIQYDSSRKVYRFWSGTADIQKLEELIQRKQQEHSLEWHKWRELVEQKISNNLPAIEPNIDWGAPSDWEPRIFIMLPEFCTETNLKALHNPYRIDRNRGNLVEGDRALILLLLAREEEDLNWYRQELPDLLETVYGQDAAVPVLALVLPMEVAGLVEHLIRFKALEDFSRSDIERIGDSSAYQSEKGRMQQSIRQQLQKIGELIRQRHPATSYIAPAHLRGVLRMRSQLTVAEAVTEAYQSSYRACPPFYTQYPTRGARGSNNNFNKAVVQVARLLLKNEASFISRLNNPLASELCRNYLIARWSLLDASHSVRPPEEPKARVVWDELDQTIPIGGSVRIEDVLIRLLNPPFGCDPGVLLLIASAWIGYHRHDLEFEASGVVQALDTLIEKIFKDCHRPSEVLLRLCYRENVGIARRDRAARQKEFEEHILQAERTNQLSLSEAQTLITRLQQALADLPLPDSLKERAEKQIKRWSQASDQAQAYDKRVSELLQATDLNALLKSFADLAQLPKYSIVLPDQPAPAEVRTTLQERLEEQVDQHCRRFEQISALEQAEHHRSQLKLLGSRLNNLRLNPSRVEQALQTLERNIAQLKQRESESVYRARLESMSLIAPLSKLRRYFEELEEIPEGSDELNTLRDQTREHIQNRIHQLETQLQRWKQTAYQITSLHDVQKLRDDVLKEQRLYENAPESSEVDILLQQIDQIRDFLEQLSHAVNSPLSERLERLHSLQCHSQAISSALQHALEEKIEQTQRMIQAEEAEAVRWLEQQRAIAQQPNCDWVRLQQALETPPQFLPAEAQEKLDQLRRQVAQRVAEDTIQQIKAQFLKLGAEDRRRLVELLQKLLGEA